MIDSKEQNRHALEKYCSRYGILYAIMDKLSL